MELTKRLCPVASRAPWSDAIVAVGSPPIQAVSTRIVAESVVVIVLLTVGLRFAQDAALFTLPDSVDLVLPAILGVAYMLFRAKLSATV